LLGCGGKAWQGERREGPGKAGLLARDSANQADVGRNPSEIICMQRNNDSVDLQNMLCWGSGYLIHAKRIPRRSSTEFSFKIKLNLFPPYCLELSACRVDALGTGLCRSIFPSGNCAVQICLWLRDPSTAPPFNWRICLPQSLSNAADQNAKGARCEA
jgi:hypothetical protein